jgi:hypothetical protein
MIREYEVTVYEVHSRTIKVKANSIDEAKELVNDEIEAGETNVDLEYSHTLDIDEWAVYFNGQMVDNDNEVVRIENKSFRGE